jgi:hypothetical protein
MVAYGFAIFSGAFLLFQVQPLVGKYLLPWFGGAPGVWTTCMVFFQVLLLGGYAYAHLSSRFLKPRSQVLLHLALLLAAVATLPVTPNPAWKPQTADDPTLRIIALLTVSLGLPYFVVSATAPLLQNWFSRTQHRASPFRLYALSNAGSLLALLSYPTFFETCLTRAAQASLWGAGLVLYALGCAWCGRLVWKSRGSPQPDGTSESPAAVRPQAERKLLWTLLPACASLLLLAITNKICQDVAVIAFLWVAPLTVYLLSFIICFDRPQWYRRAWFGPALFLVLAVMGLTLSRNLALSVPLQIVVYTGGLFACCIVCHGEVYRLKPHPEYLTSFYLHISAGGALGGVFVALLAPAVFTDYFELHWGLLLCGLLFLHACLRDLGSRPGSRRRLGWAAGLLTLAGLAFLLWGDSRRHATARVYQARNFYGVLSVNEYAGSNPEERSAELLHGRIVHGMQFLHPSRSRLPTLYFSPESGIGRTMEAMPPGARHIGVVGLGVGTLAAYTRPGDRMCYYEINPRVETAARAHFTFLKEAGGEISVRLGDARLSMEDEPPRQYDLLVLDAFSSDAIPIHLLTREAFEVYRRHLKTNGVIAVHVSNMSLNLEPIVMRLARHFHYHPVVAQQPETRIERGVVPSTWVILSPDEAFAQTPAIREVARPPQSAGILFPLWTDDFSALFPILRWREFLKLGGPETKEQARPASDFVRRGNLAAEITRFRGELGRNPDSPAAMNNLACLLATAPDAALRNGLEAVQLAEKASALANHRNPIFLSTLAAAYAESGRFDEAVSTAEKACALAAEQGERRLLERNRQLLEYYRRGQPFHQVPQ